ncbi:MAG: pectate lyase [Melioribacteraceae bacterium]|nr:MAG: pectate lyase [Melioribacteraceae bacterium]
MKTYFFLPTLLLLFTLTIGKLFSQVLAFPQAEGAGKYTVGGRGGEVIEVTNLNDSGPGSLRDALENQNYPRTIIFTVSGNIELESALKIKHDYVTIAGQTAPGEGITLKNYSLRLDADQVIVRFLRCRLGDEAQEEDDSFWGRECKNVIIDHCTMSWSIDESASFYDNENFTMQWCIISESLDDSYHSKGPHGYGGIWGGVPATFHHNLIAHHTSRNPRFNGARYTSTPETEIVDFVNNVLYNWRDNSAYGGEAGNVNIRHNYYKYGPATLSDVKARIIEPYDLDSDWYLEGNYICGYPDVTENNAMGVHGTFALAQRQKLAEEPFQIIDIQMQSAEEAFGSVTQFAGANFPFRDSIDTRVLQETIDGTAFYGATGNGIIDSQSDVGGYPDLESTTPPTDTDGDGMPDDWEGLHGLDPNNAVDGNILNSDGYTNVEVYLNELVSHTFPEYVNSVESDDLPPEQYRIAGNYPNPFNPGTFISFAADKPGELVFEIYSVAGERIDSGKITFDAAGVQEYYWNGYGERGNALPSGIYFVLAKFGGKTQTHKMILLK